MSFRCVGKVNDDIGLIERADRSRAHRLLQRVPGVEEPGSVQDHQLRVGAGVDADDAVAGRLWLGAGDAQLLADDAIQECRFADVRFSCYGDDPRSWHLAS